MDHSRHTVIVAMLAILVLSLPTAVAAAGDELLRVEYKLFGRVETAIGELSFDKGGERVSLKLFNERLADYYTLFLPYEDLVSQKQIPSSEAAKIVEERKELRERKLEQRRAEAEAKARARAAERAAETKRRIAKGEPLRRSSQAKARGLGLRGGSDRADAGRVPMAPLTSDEIFTQLEEELGPIESRLEEQRDELADLEKRIAAAVGTGGRVPREARLVRGEVRTQIGKLDKVQANVDRRRKDIERLREAVVAGKMENDDVVERGEILLRQLYGASRGLKKVETALGGMEQKIAKLPAEIAAKAARDSDREARAARPAPTSAVTAVAEVARAVDREAESSDAEEAIAERPRKSKRDRAIEAPPIELDDEGMSPMLMFVCSSVGVLAGILFLAARRPRRVMLATEEA